MTVSGPGDKPVSIGGHTDAQRVVSSQDTKIKQLFDKFSKLSSDYASGKIPVVRYRQALVQIRNALPGGEETQSLRQEIGKKLAENPRMLPKQMVQKSESDKTEGRAPSLMGADAITDAFTQIRADYMASSRSLKELQNTTENLFKHAQALDDSESNQVLKKAIKQFGEQIVRDLVVSAPPDKVGFSPQEEKLYQIFRQAMNDRAVFRIDENLKAFIAKTERILDLLRDLLREVDSLSSSTEKTEILGQVLAEIDEQTTFLESKKQLQRVNDAAQRRFSIDEGTSRT